MAAQAAATEQVVGQIERRGDCQVDRDFRKRSKGGLGVKGGAHTVDFFCCGEMQGSSSLGYLSGMACAAGLLHLVRVGGLFDEPGMGLLLCCSLWVSLVAGGAGEIMAGVEPDRRMASLASGRAGRSFLRSGLFWSLALLATGQGQGKQAEKQQDSAGFYVAAKRHGGCVPSGLINIPAILPYLRHRQQAAIE